MHTSSFSWLSKALANYDIMHLKLHKLKSWTKAILKCFRKLIANQSPVPEYDLPMYHMKARASHSHRTRGYLCSFPITRTPPPPSYLGEKVIHGYTPLSRVLVTVGNLQKTPLFPVFFSGNLPETTAKKYPPFPRKWCMWIPYAFKWGARA